MGIGSLVSVKEPFKQFFPGTYVIEGISETGAFQIAGGIDFAEEHLELVV